MGKPTAFMEQGREGPRRRPVPVRLRDWLEVYEPSSPETTRTQASRCMDCGIPFCHEGCPLGNLIPEWNDLAYRDDWAEAIERLHATNNFPELTGRLCPAPCEAACVLALDTAAVTIERIEYEIAERAFAQGWVRPQLPATSTGLRVGIVGSGPAGLACAQQLARAGHSVTVYERAARPGGLLRYGIPEFKLEKRVLDRRLAQLRAEGVTFVCSTSVGGRPPDGRTSRSSTHLSLRALLQEVDAVVLAGGASVPRDLDVPGRHLRGVHFAIDYLKPANQVQEGTLDVSPLDATGKHVLIIGGGDTGADCLGTAHRQGAASTCQLEILPEPPSRRGPDHPWPVWPVIVRSSAAHEEGGRRMYSLATTELVDDGGGAVAALRARDVTLASGATSQVAGHAASLELPCDLVLLAMGFEGAERHGAVEELGLVLDPRGSVQVDSCWETSMPRVFACGDMVRGQSLVVWAIAEGRAAAAGVDLRLTGSTALAAPVVPGQLALR